MLPLIDAFEELLPRIAHFCSPDQSLKIQQWLIGFVDNNTIVFTYKDKSFDPSIVNKLFEMAEEVLVTKGFSLVSYITFIRGNKLITP